MKNDIFGINDMIFMHFLQYAKINIISKACIIVNLAAAIKNFQGQFNHKFVNS